MDNNRIIKKLQNALKLGGFNIRRELCTIIVEEFTKRKINLSDKIVFEDCITHLSSSLENQCIAGQSIEEGQVVRAVEIFLNSGLDRNETAFSVIEAFDFPKFYYDPDRKLYLLSKQKSKLLSDATSKSMVFIERYQTILQKTRRMFLSTASAGEKNMLKLQTVDFLLTISNVCLKNTLILGSIIQVSEGKYCLEDPTGMVNLDMSHANFQGGLFVENSFVLVNGVYEDKTLTVSTMLMPPGEAYEESRASFANINYFGGPSRVPLRDSKNLREHAERNENGMIQIFSDVWLDHALVFEKLETLFEGFQEDPPIAFLFLGNFVSESHGHERMDILKKCFKQLGELLSRYQSLISNSQFVFVPGTTDPSTPHIVPRLSLPSYIIEDFLKLVPKAVFTTNPCRIQYCHREITVFRCDLLTKLLQGALSKPNKDHIADYVTRTVISQGHLTPMSLNSQPVHWDFDYTLRLHPLPDLIILGDKSETYIGEHKGCKVVNPGPFCEKGFEFISYTPFTNSIEPCAL
ncbi:DNA polymerase epsilon subunit 2 [Coccinella septempunctata]|uniref:DNA polymerase epsilon subunit 2 n=1 Tax=Coccinella septempunctata TaxID=41139 RepID=UPI001D0675DB|nr:DNA polymerase epsilon subunit 2 [Coccinella septempunctata]